MYTSCKLKSDNGIVPDILITCLTQHSDNSLFLHTILTHLYVPHSLLRLSYRTF